MCTDTLTLSSANSVFTVMSFLNISPPTITAILHFDHTRTHARAHRERERETHTHTHTHTLAHTQTELKISSNMLQLSIQNCPLSRDSVLIKERFSWKFMSSIGLSYVFFICKGRGNGKMGAFIDKR